MSLWTSVPQKEGRFNPAFAAPSGVFKDHPAYTAVLALVAGRELKARGRQDAMSVRMLSLETGIHRPAGVSWRVLVWGSLVSGFHVKGSFLLDNKLWSLKSPSSPFLFLHTRDFIS